MEFEDDLIKNGVFSSLDISEHDVINNATSIVKILFRTYQRVDDECREVFKKINSIKKCGQITQVSLDQTLKLSEYLILKLEFKKALVAILTVQEIIK